MVWETTFFIKCPCDLSTKSQLLDLKRLVSRKIIFVKPFLLLRVSRVYQASVSGSGVRAKTEKSEEPQVKEITRIHIIPRPSLRSGGSATQPEGCTAQGMDAKRSSLDPS
jgi:hypothetical protein